MLIGLLVLIGCSPEQQNLPVPLYTERLLELADDCKCQIDSPRVVCLCEQPKQEADIRITCSKAPADLYEAMTQCTGEVIGKWVIEGKAPRKYMEDGQ